MLQLKTPHVHYGSVPKLEIEAPEGWETSYKLFESETLGEVISMPTNPNFVAHYDVLMTAKRGSVEIPRYLRRAITLMPSLQGATEIDVSTLQWNTLHYPGKDMSGKVIILKGETKNTIHLGEIKANTAPCLIYFDDVLIEAQGGTALWSDQPTKNLILAGSTSIRYKGAGDHAVKFQKPWENLTVSGINLLGNNLCKVGLRFENYTGILKGLTVFDIYISGTKEEGLYTNSHTAGMIFEKSRYFRINVHDTGGDNLQFIREKGIEAHDLNISNPGLNKEWGHTAAIMWAEDNQGSCYNVYSRGGKSEIFEGGINNYFYNWDTEGGIYIHTHKNRNTYFSNCTFQGEPFAGNKSDIDKIMFNEFVSAYDFNGYPTTSQGAYSDPVWPSDPTYDDGYKEGFEAGKQYIKDKLIDL